MITIREAIINDVEDLHELYMKHLTQFPPCEEQIIEKWSELLLTLIENPDYHIFVGELEGKVISSVTLIVIRNLNS